MLIESKIMPVSTEIEKQLVEFVVTYPFNNVAVVLDFLTYLEQVKSSPAEAFKTWSPESSSLVEKYGGTNCVGSTKLFKEQLRRENIDAKEAVFKFNLYAFGLNESMIPYSHVALLVEDQEAGLIYLVDPGLGLTAPVLANGEKFQIADRDYELILSDGSGELYIYKPDGSKIYFEFSLLPHDKSLEDEVQKPLLRGTTAFKIDAFEPTGFKSASIKVDIFKRTLGYFCNGISKSIDFGQLEQLFFDPEFLVLAEKLGYSPEKLTTILRTLKDKSKDIVGVWLEQVQKEYYLHYSEELSPIETSWEDLASKDYLGGGVVLIFVNENNEILMYEVPKEREKPGIDRFAGQLNLFTETADNLDPDKGVLGLENFNSNFRRALSEEIGIDSEISNYNYRETDYRDHIRARVVIIRCSSLLKEMATLHARQRELGTGKVELGRMSWVKLSDLDLLDLEPNAKKILKKVVNEGLI